MYLFGYPYYGYGFYFDPTYILIIIGAVISLIASAKVKSTYAKYSTVRSMSGYTGASVADAILRRSGIYDVRIEHISGNLTDHYDPRSKVLRLSDSVYNSNSVAAIGVAAHECGHAIQHAKGYAPLTIRSAIVPVVNFGSSISWFLILAGLFITNGSGLITLGIILFSTAVIFQLVTLPVEFNASRRALAILGDGLIVNTEVKDARKVLSAAALTYVAGAIASILQLLRLIILFGGRNRD
ncbi:probable metal-dependent peptidase [Lachnospiraceae bacterium KM106-2]|nr:probable metal-dependent peptidase [Lachnospiraceae bacterium KM106-2]